MKIDKFNKVVIRNVTEHPHNIHIAVHPFPFSNILMMMRKGDYTMLHNGAKLNEWQAKLADELWDNIPGISDMFYSNGEITIQHRGIFEDNDIYEAASEIIKPYLEENLNLNNLLEE